MGHPTKHCKNYYGTIQLLIKKEQDCGVTAYAWDKNNLGPCLLPFFIPPKPTVKSMAKRDHGS